MRHLLAGVRAGTVSTAAVGDELGISQRWVQRLQGKYLAACAQGCGAQWAPGRSGGQHRKALATEIEALWRKLLSSHPPASYSFIASESLRRHRFEVDRATVRRWALHHGLVPSAGAEREPAAIRRWQCESVGALWQLDVSSHRWFGEANEPLPLFDMLDDCSRVFTGTWLYPRECLLAYLDFLRRAFEEYGLPAGLYVDQHSFFLSSVPGMRTYLGEVLQWLGISFKYAPTARAKGKVERQHQFWQNRLPAYFAAEQIREIEEANPHIQELRWHHNREEIHRELAMTPDQAWKQAIKAKRCVLRRRPATAWWPYLWTVRNVVKVAFDGTVSMGAHRVKVDPLGSRRLTCCEHPDGSFTLLANDFGVGKPIVLRRIEVAHPTWNV